LLVGHGLGLPSPTPDPAADRSGWPDLWGVLRAIRDTTAVSRISRSNLTDAVSKNETTSEATPSRTPTLGQVTKQVSDRIGNMFQSVRSSLWQLTGSAGASSTTTTTVAPDLEAGASSDVLGKEAADKSEPLDAAPAKEQKEAPSFVSTALERVRGAGRTFSEMGKAVGRWGKAMADSVVGSTVNSAVGTVLQVFKGGKQDDDADHVCFPELGCFSLLEPWSSSKRPLPRMNAPEEVQTRFFLYTRNTSSAEPIALAVTNNDTVANATALLQDVRTFFVVHGFNDKTTNAWVQDLKDALLERMESNVVLVDWASGAQASRNYLQAASNTRVVGAELARLAESLAEQDVVPMDTMHVIGHSLGAHAAGYAGKQLNGRLGRITALDAAQPAFEDQAAEVRVAAGDAVFVDVVHTNGVPFIPTLGLGVMHPFGDVDFYLNGGTVQPGCFVPKLPPMQSLMDLAALPVSVLGDMLSCSHRRAIEYFTEAVRSDCLMWGRRRDEDALDADRSDKRPAASEAATPSTRPRQGPWWSPAGGLGGLLAGVFGDKPAPTTEAPSTASAGSAFSFPLPSFLASVFSSEGRRGGGAANKSAAVKDKSVSKDAVKDREKAADVRPIDGNGIDKTGDFPASAPDDSITSDSSPVAAHSKRSPLAAAPSAWCQSEDCLPLGLDADLYNLKGTFTVLTADHAPYCLSGTDVKEAE
ncbi:uncharacterized protein LOC117649322, partial [Thrips palmi]|uniref:Uncharacterized protein LOC117649322 n=1 Tax=Thrips palmi TaxID=161013 RepID=A0A6P8ZRR8_THRPL